MTLSRHAQVENLANALRARRTLLRERACRQAAYMNLVGAILGVSVAEIQAVVPVAPMHPVLAPFPEHTYAA